MGCISEEMLLGFIAGRLSTEASATVEQHLSDCDPCRELLAATAESSGTGVAEATAPQAAGEDAGRYEILGPIGAGGMAVVYAARDRQLDRTVALKMLRSSDPAETPQELRGRLLREARAMARLAHPNVLPVFEVGLLDDHVFVAMEFVEGGNLAQWLREKPRRPAEVLEVFLAAGRGLAAAHAVGMVHRDFKPDNVLIGRDGRVRVTDFGLARIAAAPEGARGADPAASAISRSSGALAGSPAYMAPEQMRGERAGSGSDLFSFCVALWEALFGARPFAGSTLAELESSIRRGEIAEPAESKGVPRRIRAVLEKGLSADPARRPRSMDALLTALAEANQSRVSARRMALLALLACIAGGAVVVAAMRFRSPVPVPAQVPSVAVLPFADLSPDKGDDALSDGFAEEVLNALARVDGVRVAGRISSFLFKGKNEEPRSIGRSLQVNAILDGTILSSGSRLSVSARLVSAETGRQLWSQTYEREPGQILTVEDDIARAVLDALGVAQPEGQGPRIRRPVDPEAYLQFLLGRQLPRRGHTSQNFQASIEAYERAIAIEPGYAPAWSGLAWSLSASAYSAATPLAMAGLQQRALQAADKAIALDPELADAYVARSALRTELSWDWAGARADLERALKINPGDARAWRQWAQHLASLGRLPDAIAKQRRALALDPLLPSNWVFLGLLYHGTGELALARSAISRGIELAPEGPVGRSYLGMNSLLRGDPAGALAEAGRSSEESRRLPVMALALHDLGRSDESALARETLIAKYAHSYAFQIAEIYAWQGDRDRAFEWLERARATHDGGLMDLKYDPLLVRIRRDPRYAGLLRNLNLPTD